jgi:Tol biopolymer transport system component
LYVQQIAGGAPLRLTTNEASDITPDFSPDGTRVVFLSVSDSYLAVRLTESSSVNIWKAQLTR